MILALQTISVNKKKEVLITETNKKNWEVKKLGEVLLKTEMVDPTKNPNKEFTYLDVASVNKETKEIEGVTVLEGKDAPSRARKLVRTNDVIFATVRPTHSRVALITEEYDGLVCSTGYFVLRGKENIDNKYLFYFLLTDEFNQQMEKLQKGASYPAVTDAEVKSIFLRYPKSLSEQKHIVSILDEAFAAIAKAKAIAEQNLKNAKEIFESYLQEVFEKKGKDWEEKRFEELIQYNQIGLIKSSKEQGVEKAYRYLKMDSISSNNSLLHDRYVYVNASKEELTKFTLDEGDFLFNTRNSYELVGKTCVFTLVDEEPTLFNNNIMRVKFYPGNSSKFINYAFTSALVKDRLQKLKSGTTSVVGIYYNGLRNLLVPVTKNQEQQTIVRKLDALQTETKKLEAIYQKKINDLEELKKSILQRAFNGEIV
jgi:type I restriction enzyme, S subunit